MRTILRTLPALLAALAPACRTVPAAEVGAGATHAAYRAPLATSLQVETGTDSTRLVLLVTNAGEAPVALDFGSGQSHDFAVLEGGRELWRWSEGRMFTQALRTDTLAPGETRPFAEWWRPDAAVPRGRALVAVATLRITGRPVEQRAEFRLP